MKALELFNTCSENERPVLAVNGTSGYHGQCNALWLLHSIGPMSGAVMAEFYDVTSKKWMPDGVHPSDLFRLFDPKIDKIPEGCALPARYEQYAYKPPKPRPWKGPEEVPLDLKWLRFKERPIHEDKSRWLFLGTSSIGILWGSNREFSTWDSMVQFMEWSPNGTDWKTCGVIEK